MSKIDKIIEHFRNIHEDGAVAMPTMNTNSVPGAPGFGAYSNARGPVAGVDAKLGKYDGRSKIMRRLPKFYRDLFNKTKK